MPHDLEYVITGALIECSEGTVPGLFQTTPRTTKIGGLLAGNELDKAPIANIPSFVICKKLTQQAGGTPVPCMPVPTSWQDTYPAKIGGGKALLFKSCIQCAAGGGKIGFVTSGQSPVPPQLSQQLSEMKKEVDDALAEAEKEKGAVGEAGFFEGMIPLWGSGRDLIHSVQTGDGWGIALNAGFLVWDVVSIAAGIVSFGTATAAMMGAKTGIRAAVKAAGKVTAKMAAQKAVQLSAKAVALKQGLKKGIKGLAAKIPKLSVTSCFPAGTPIAIQDGYKPIEQIQKGDLVWAWHEQTADLALRPVVQTIKKQSDALVEIRVGNETLQATPEHPFWVDGQWKQAGELEKGDELLRSDGFKTPILNVVHHTEKPTEVYNFEVADWHTYLVGYWMWVVHNAKVCLFEEARKGVEYAQNILKGIKFNHLRNKELTAQYGTGVAHELWLKVKKKVGDIEVSSLTFRLDSYIPNKEIISRKATQMAETTVETAKKHIDELVKKYKKDLLIANTKRAGSETLQGDYILEIPKQKAPIPQEILDHAKKKDVFIRELDHITDAKLKYW